MNRRAALVLLAFVAVPLFAQAPPRAVGRSLVGELLRIDLGRSAVTLKLDGEKPSREYELLVDAETRYVSQGRALKLGDLRAGQRAVVVLREDGAFRRVTLLKLTK